MSNEKLSILVPYRNRKEHLDTFIPYIENYLSTNIKNKFEIIVIEQANDELFNRGALLNIGFLLEKYNCTYISPHDVDLLPEDADYSLPNMPTHLAAYRSQKNYKLEYEEFFGGVNLFLNKHFEKVNGFSNYYAGYGAEDDDLRYRCVISDLLPERRNCRYQSLFHEPITSATKENETLWYNIKKGQYNSTLLFDGLNSIKYKILDKFKTNYTHYYVDFKNERLQNE
jgi:hypothetical protein